MIEYVIAPDKKISLGIKELVQHKELFYFFTWRDIKVKYKQTVLGFAWVILQPLTMMAIFTLFVSKTLNISSGDLAYPVFSFSGIIIWNVFSSGISNAGGSMLSNSNIIKKIYFPRLIIPLSAILVSLFDFFISFILFIALILIYGQQIYLTNTLVFLPLSILILMLTSFGAGTLLSALTIKYRDFKYVIPFMIQALMFVSPVIYPTHLIQNKIIQTLIYFNPVAVSVELFRSIFTPNNPWHLHYIPGVIFSIVLVIYGLFYFKKTEKHFADIA